ncbi:MAG: DUF433 domain-containing protein [Actinobacteria bacterium]|nr:DUF433 domain-containing protein [Actinomycetota bacterium]
MGEVEVLDRVLYSTEEAARLLGVHSRTLKNWLDGYRVRGRFYAPVIRAQPTGVDEVTWGEFVEAGLLAEYRRVHKVPMQHIRPVIDDLRDNYGVPFPLAHYRPFSGDKELVFELQARAGVEERLGFVIYRSGQLVLNAPAEAFLHKVEFEDDVARRYRPGGMGSPIVIDPERAFGVPTIDGIRTEVLYEQFEAGDSIDLIAQAYELDRDAVEEAIRYEASRGREAPQAA